MKTAILMGSDSDWHILKPAVEVLKRFGIEPVVQVASAQDDFSEVLTLYSENIQSNPVPLVRNER